MRTISQVVEEVVGRSPFLAEAIAEDVANNAKVARKIKPEVEKRLLEEVSEASVAMALHRLSKEMKRPQFGARFLAKMSDITVRGDLVQFVCPNSTDVSEALESVARGIGSVRGVFFNYARGLHETVLIVSGDMQEKVACAFQGVSGVVQTTGLSAVTMRLPEESLAVPGVYYPILKAVALEGISLEEVLSVRDELSIVVADRDIDRTFSVIKRITSRLWVPKG